MSNRKQKPVPNGKPKPKFNVMWVYLLLGAGLLVAYFWGSDGANFTAAKQLDDTAFSEMILHKQIDKAEYVKKEDKVFVYLKKSVIDSEPDYKEFRGKNALDGPHYFLEESDLRSFKESVDKTIDRAVTVLAKDSILRLQEQLGSDSASQVANSVPTEDALRESLRRDYQFPIGQDNSKSWGNEIMLWIFPILFLLFFIFMMRGMGNRGGMFSIGKSKAQLFDEKSNSNISFKDVAGLDGAKEEVEEIVDFLKNPKKYTVLGGKIPKGALLVGPPGTGKTLLARAVAGEAKVPFFSLSGSDFVEMFVGVGASRVRDLFKTAKEKAPCIIFIDEIDAIGRAHGKSISGGSDERESTLNQLLTEMDGFSTNTGVIILAATNRAEILDRALLRAGRFDRQIHVELPNLTERKGIFEVHVRKLKLGNDVDLDFFAKQTPGFSGADIANVCNEAALIAARHSKSSIDKEDFLAAIDRIIGGLEKRSSLITPHEKRVIAFHESGHATVSWLSQHAAPLVKVTIVPRGRALGAAWYLPEERQITTFEQMFDELCSLVGGRAAEEVAFGEVSTGALNDLERVTKMAYAMVAYYGLNKSIGNLSYYDSTGQSEYSFNRPYSEKTAEEIDKQVHELVESAYARAKQILESQRENLEKLATLLIDREVIFAEDLEKIYGKRPSSEIDAETHASDQAQSETSEEENSAHAAANQETEQSLIAEN